MARGLVGRQYPAHCNEKNDRSLEFELSCSRPASSGKATPVIERRKAMQTSIEPSSGSVSQPEGGSVMAGQEIRKSKVGR